MLQPRVYRNRAPVLQPRVYRNRAPVLQPRVYRNRAPVLQSGCCSDYVGKNSATACVLGSRDGANIVGLLQCILFFAKFGTFANQHLATQHVCWGLGDGAT